MEKKILFPQIGGIMHGGDYNPDSGWTGRTFWKKISV